MKRSIFLLKVNAVNIYLAVAKLLENKKVITFLFVLFLKYRYSLWLSTTRNRKTILFKKIKKHSLSIKEIEKSAWN